MLELGTNKNLKNLLAVFGLEINRIKTILEFPIELSKQEQELVNHIFEMKYSMTSVNNLLATALACKSIIKNDIAGDFVECGTYRGGHALLAAAIFNLNNSPRKVWLYDTFEGMAQPQEVDVEFKTGVEALQYYNLNKVSASNIWCYASLNEVRDNFKRMPLLSDDIKFI